MLIPINVKIAHSMMIRAGNQRFGAHREPVRTSHLKKRAGDLAPGLKEVGIEYQLQLARPIRLRFLVLRLQEFGFQRVDIDTFDEHCPRRHRPRIGTLGSRRLGVDRRTIDGEVIQFRIAGLPCFVANAPLPVRVPAATNLRSVPANQVLALVRNVLGDFAQEVQGAEDLKVTHRSAS